MDRHRPRGLARAPADGATLDFAAVLVIESLLYAIRSVAFFVPNAIGVQEGAYVMLGAGFGLAPISLWRCRC